MIGRAVAKKLKIRIQRHEDIVELVRHVTTMLIQKLIRDLPGRETQIVERIVEPLQIYVGDGVRISEGCGA